MKATALSILLVASLVSAGCAAGGALEAPLVSVTAMKVTEQTDQGARVEVTLALRNPNATALPLVRSTYAVTVDGLGTFEFDDDSQRVVPAGGGQTLVLPAAFALPGRGAAPSLRGVGCGVRGEVAYHPGGLWRRFLDELDYPLPSVAVQAAGALD